MQGMYGGGKRKEARGERDLPSHLILVLSSSPTLSSAVFNGQQHDSFISLNTLRPHIYLEIIYRNCETQF